MPEITYAQTIMECLHNDVAAADINYSTNALANLSLHAFSIHFLTEQTLLPTIGQRSGSELTADVTDRRTVRLLPQSVYFNTFMHARLLAQP